VKIRLAIISLFCLLIHNCDKKEVLPQNILEYDLVKTVSGLEAQKMVNRIHLQPVTDTKNEIGFYEKDAETTIIYVTHYPSEKDAQEALIKMVEKISPKNYVFINGGQVEVNNMLAYLYFGMGQTHYVFTVRNMLFWFSVDTMVAQDFLELYI
jgi:hypothetical protein